MGKSLTCTKNIPNAKNKSQKWKLIWKIPSIIVLMYTITHYGYFCSYTNKSVISTVICKEYVVQKISNLHTYIFLQYHFLHPYIFFQICLCHLVLIRMPLNHWEGVITALRSPPSIKWHVDTDLVSKIQTNKYYTGVSWRGDLIFWKNIC